MTARWLFPLLFIASIMACELRDDHEVSLQDDTLSISHDTIQFDTLVSGRLSITKRFRIYNHTPTRQTISELSLGQGKSSPYRMIVNAKEAFQLNELSIDSGDSLLILVDLLPPEEQSSLFGLIEDQILIQSTGVSERLILQAWSLNTEYFEKSIICDQFWGADKVHLVTDTLVVDSACTLRIEAGTTVLFDKGSGLFVRGKLLAQGTQEAPIRFRYSRLDQYYKQAPGQWVGIYFLEGSTDNIIEYATIENGQVGLRIGTPDNDTIPDVTIRNVSIRHLSQQGILAFSSDLLAENVAIYDVGLQAGFHAIGGSYSYNHATLTNYPSQIGGEDATMVFADHLIVGEDVLYEALSVSVTNSILWGGAVESDLLISLDQPNTAFVLAENNIIFSEQNLSGNTVSTDLSFPAFVDPFVFDYHLDSLSPAVNSAEKSFLLLDLDGESRDSLPDIGAFEFRPNED